MPGGGGDYAPGVGGVDPRLAPAAAAAPPIMAALPGPEPMSSKPPRLPVLLVLLAYSLVLLAACVCCTRSVSSLTGDGMNPTSQPSLTSRPIHHRLSYFS